LKLGAWACTAVAAALHAGGLEFASLLAEVGSHTLEVGEALKDRPRDVVRKAAERFAKRIEREHRDWLIREFGSDPSGRAEMTGLLAALPDVLADTLPDRLTVAHANLDARAIADAAVAKAGRTDERFRPDTFGARVLHSLIVGAYEAAKADTAFAAAMRLAIDQVLLERTAATAAATQRIEALLKAGTTPLHLLPRHHLKAEARNLRELLMTELRATDLVGRQEELALLKLWLAMPREGRDISVHCLTGQGGAGKTRLAIELCEWAEHSGWSAGFVGHDELERFHTLHHPSEWRWPRPTLVVVDYAAASGRVLRSWLAELARDKSGEHESPLRVLLLERHADRDAGWWSELIREGGLSGRGPDALIDDGAPLKLGPLRAVEDRRALLAQVMQKAGQLLGKTPLPLPPPGVDALFDRRLADDAIETEPLFLVMAGIVAVDTGAPSALALGRLDLAGKVAAAEGSRLDRLAHSAGADASLVLHLAACVTLQGGCDADAATALVHDERAALGDHSLMRTDQLAALLGDALPPPNGTGVDAVRPDLIGEAFLLDQIERGRRSLAQQTAIIERAFRRAGQRVVATVIRTAQDHASGDAAHAGVVWLDHLARLTDDPFALMAIANQLPQQTLALRDRSAEITGRIVAGLAVRVTADPDLLPLLAAAQNNLGVRLSELGEREAALAAAREAAELYRALAAQRPDAFRPDLAMSLWVLADCLDAVDRRDEGLAANAEAITELSGLFQRHKRTFAGQIAGMAQEYLRRCETLGREPDEQLLAPVAAGLAELQSSPETPA
jgi:tetratricopeptide (TPR) repeat protein